MSNGIAIEWLLIRHASATKHGNFASVDSLIESPFASGASSSGEGMIDKFFQPSSRWVSVCQFSKLSWFVVDTNQNKRALFDHFSKSRRLEVVWLKSAEESLEAKITKGRRVSLDLNATPASCDFATSIEELQSSLEIGSDLAAYFNCIQQALDVPKRIPSIQVKGKHFQVIGIKGKPVKSGVKAFTLFNASGLSEGASPASELLDSAIENCDLPKLKNAIAAGANLEQRPESAVSPLVYAMYQVYRGLSWKPCAQALLEAGALVDGVEGSVPPIVQVCSHLIEPKHSEELLKFLIENGAKVDHGSDLGPTALLESVSQGRLGAVKILVAAGAKPHLKSAWSFAHQCPLDVAQERFDRDVRSGATSEFTEILTVLTGEQPELPEIHVPANLMAEAARMREAFHGIRLTKLLRQLPPAEKIKSTRLVREEYFSETKAELEKIGFLETAKLQAFADDLIIGLSSELGFDSSAAMTAKMISMIQLVVMTNPSTQMDVILSGNSFEDVLFRVEVVAQSEDRLWISCNKAFSDYTGQFVERKAHKHDSAAKLVLKLTSRTRSEKLLPTPVEAAEERVTGLLSRVREDYLASLNSGNDNANMPGAPRYERLEMYLELWDAQKYPNQTIRDFANREVDDIQETVDPKSEFRLSGALTAMASLLAFEHLEYLGAIPRKEYFGKGTRHVRAWVNFYTTRNQKFPESWGIAEFAYAMLITILDGVDEEWSYLCEIAKANLTRCRFHPEERKQPELAKVILLIASSYRENPIRGSKKYPAEIMSGKSTHAKRLLEAWQAIENADQPSFNSSLKKALEQSRKYLAKHPDKFHPWFKLAWLESILCVLAVPKGLEIPDLELRLSDLLLVN